MADQNELTQSDKKIVIEVDGPYRVIGNIPLVRKTQVMSEYGEPLIWKKEEDIPTNGEYRLCRCGLSKEKPFCDDAHFEFGFDGTETAETNTFEERKVDLPDGVKIIVKRDHSLCMDSGFCANRITGIKKMMAQTDEPRIRAEIIAMIERCPSGSYTYALNKDEADIEPDFPQQIAVTTEFTSERAVRSALWVTGNIPIERSDGKPFETRNRVTLCACGESKIQPLCDGAHRQIEATRIK